MKNDVHHYQATYSKAHTYQTWYLCIEGATSSEACAHQPMVDDICHILHAMYVGCAHMSIDICRWQATSAKACTHKILCMHNWRRHWSWLACIQHCLCASPGDLRLGLRISTNDGWYCSWPAHTKSAHMENDVYLCKGTSSKGFAHQIGCVCIDSATKVLACAYHQMQNNIGNGLHTSM